MIKDMYAGEKEKEFELFYLADIETNWFSFAPMGEAAEEDAKWAVLFTEPDCVASRTRLWGAWHSVMASV